MRPQSYWLIALLALGTIGGAVTLSLTSGQTPTRPTNPENPPITPPAIKPVAATGNGPGLVTPAVANSPALPKVVHDLDKMPAFTRQVHLSAQRGAEWLHRVDNPVTGRFLPGLVPAL